jgi:galactokinase/mevalonate kinase-like predicted kinase
VNVPWSIVAESEGGSAGRLESGSFVPSGVGTRGSEGVVVAMLILLQGLEFACQLKTFDINGIATNRNGTDSSPKCEH